MGDHCGFYLSLGSGYPRKAESMTKAPCEDLLGHVVPGSRSKEKEWKRKGGTNSNWPLVSVTGCLVLMKWPVVLGEEGKHVSSGCRLPWVHATLLGCMCVGPGDCVPGAGCRSKEAHGMGVR